MLPNTLKDKKRPQIPTMSRGVIFIFMFGLIITTFVANYFSISKCKETIKSGLVLTDKVLTKVDNLVTVSPNSSKYVYANLSDQEQNVIQKNRCNGPLQHCCVGQCRWIEDPMRNQTVEMMVRPTWIQRDITSLLEILDKRQKKFDVDTCNLWFVGDSMSVDHLTAAVCQLSQIGYIVRNCHGFFAMNRNFGRDNQFCSERFPKKKSVFDRDDDLSAWTTVGLMFEMESVSSPHCNKIRLLYSWWNEFKDPLERVKSMPSSSSGLVVWNFGTWCNHDDCMRNRLIKFFPPVWELINEMPAWELVFRETEPQHSNGTGGIYHPENPLGCVASDSYNNFRNEAVMRFFTYFNFQVPIVPIFDAISPLWKLHATGDCSHFCYMPWRFDVTWDGIVEVLQHL